jgi:hypothetical protein
MCYTVERGGNAVLSGLNINTANLTALMMEATGTSETSINFYRTTWRKISEHSPD